MIGLKKKPAAKKTAKKNDEATKAAKAAVKKTRTSSKSAGAPVASARHYEIISKPLITEKATRLSEHNKVMFRVRPDARKDEIKKAVESLFSVKVVKVNTLNVAGKRKVFRGMRGQRSDFKKAVVTLASGQTIDFASGVK